MSFRGHSALQNKTPQQYQKRVESLLTTNEIQSHKHQKTATTDFLLFTQSETLILKCKSRCIKQPDICWFVYSGQGDCSSNVSESQTAAPWRTRLSSDISDVRNHSSPGDALGDYMVHYKGLSMQSDEFISCCVGSSTTNHSSLYLVDGDGL